MRQIPKSLTFAACIAFSTLSWAEKDANPIKSQVLECAKVTQQALTSKTDRATNARKSNDAYATVELARDASDPTGSTCVATYTLYISQYSNNFKPVKTFSVRLRDSAGVDVLGFSDSGTMLAADFWWSVADYKAHRPVVYDLKAKVARMNELDDLITSQLPPCDYSEELTRVTDNGDVVIHVPQSEHVDKGCPDQGNWLLDSKAGTVRRQQ